MKLNNRHEMVGTIAKVEEEGRELKLTFSVEKTIEIPKTNIDIAKLKTMLGARIGILNLDESYKIRVVK